MARRRSKPKRRTYRRFKGLKLIPAVASYATISALTTMAFNLNAWNFFTYDWGGTGRGPSGGLAQGQYNMSLSEIVKAYAGLEPMGYLKGNKTVVENIWHNVQQNWPMALGTVVVAGAAPKILNKLPGRPIQKMNRGLKMIGVGDMFKL